MSVDVMQSDFLACRRVQRRTFTASVVVHAVILALLLRGGAPDIGEGEELTEVSLLESSAPQPAAAPAAPAPPAPVTQKGVMRVREDEAGPEGTTRGTAPLALSRGGNGGGRDLRLAQLPADRPAPPSASPPPKAVSKQALSGISLAGPIADRPVLSAVRPEYPDWAKQEAVEGSVTLQFVVLSDGTLKPNVMVEKTAGFGDFDDNAIAALRQWRFAPLARGRTGDQWGTITFHFRLADAR
jgi:protein TonB